MILLKLSWLSCGDSLGGTCLEHSGVRFPCSIAAPQPLKVRGSEDFTNMRWSLVLGIKMKVNLLGLVTGLGFQPDWPVEPGQKAPSRAHPLQKGHTPTQFGKLQPHPIGSVTEPLSTAPFLLLLSSLLSEVRMTCITRSAWGQEGQEPRALQNRPSTVFDLYRPSSMLLEAAKFLWRWGLGRRRATSTVVSE